MNPSPLWRPKNVPFDSRSGESNGARDARAHLTAADLIVAEARAAGGVLNDEQRIAAKEHLAAAEHCRIRTASPTRSTGCNWETVRLSKDGGGSHLLASPLSPGQPQLVGARVHLSTDMPLGTALVMNAPKLATVYVRSDIRVDFTASHADYWQRNLLCPVSLVRLRQSERSCGGRPLPDSRPQPREPAGPARAQPRTPGGTLFRLFESHQDQ